jgi:hypothetical protein
MLKNEIEKKTIKNKTKKKNSSPLKLTFEILFLSHVTKIT